MNCRKKYIELYRTLQKLYRYFIDTYYLFRISHPVELKRDSSWRQTFSSIL